MGIGAKLMLARWQLKYKLMVTASVEQLKYITIIKAPAFGLSPGL